MIIYIITHKPFKKVTNSDLYKTLLVGADTNNGLDDYIKDNDFPENISYKNPHFCELTGLYWMWKRSKEDYLGLCHYRRYFTDDNGHILDNSSTVLDMLHDYDIILPQRVPDMYEGLSAKEHFSKSHDVTVWNKVKKIISINYSDYLKDFEWFEGQTTGYSYNMMITKKSLLNKYCEWLFSILFQLEKQVDIEKYDPYNQRMFGFVSERLMNVWVQHNSLRVRELPVCFAEDRSIIQKIRTKIYKIKNRLIRNRNQRREKNDIY